MSLQVFCDNDTTPHKARLKATQRTLEKKKKKRKKNLKNKRKKKNKKQYYREKNEIKLLTHIVLRSSWGKHSHRA